MGRPDSAPSRPIRIPRRTVIATGVGAIAAGLAGCTGGQTADEPSDGEGTNSNEEGAETDAPEGTETVDESAASEPIDPVPEDENCAVCNMMAAEYPDWNAQVSHEDNERAYFCSPGCLVAYYADPGHFEEGRLRDDVGGVWTRDADSAELIDGTAARYVLEMDADRIDAPMMRNPVPFESEDGALAYVDRYDDLTKHDIVGLDAFDVALARKYRMNALPETDAASIVDSVSVPADVECAVCNMLPAEYPEWNAQLSHENGDRAHFCSTGCLIAYYADTEQFAGDQTQDDIVGVWVHDLGTAEVIDGTLAHYVLDMIGDRHPEMPMMRNPMPFADRADADDYAAEYDDLGSDEIVGLEDFDVDIAAQYRPNFF